MTSVADESKHNNMSTHERVSSIVSIFAIVVLFSFSGLAFVAQRLLFSGSVSPTRWALVTFTPVLFAVYGFLRRSLSSSGAACAVVVGAVLTLAHLGYFAALITFFITASRATKFRQRQKKIIEGEAFKAGGKRNWIQVRKLLNIVV